jgi:hypothetical protein
MPRARPIADRRVVRMVVAASMPKVSASVRRRWAISALRSAALDGMHPTFRHPALVVGFDDGYRQTQLRGADGGHVPPEPAPSTTTSYRIDQPFPSARPLSLAGPYRGPYRPLSTVSPRAGLAVPTRPR